MNGLLSLHCTSSEDVAHFGAEIPPCFEYRLSSLEVYSIGRHLIERLFKE